jgi:hypothetical protein
MSAKRRSAIKRQGYNDFCPDCPPDYRYGAKVLTDKYDMGCYLEGHDKAQNEHDKEYEGDNT